MKLLLFILWCGLPFSFMVNAQPVGLHFRKLGNLNENSSNFVSDFIKDTKGRVWIGGQRGFYSYDGAHFLEYRKTKAPGSIVNNFVHALCEDKNGNIWGGTASGMFCFSPDKQVFRNYLVPLPNSPQSVLDILCDSDGNIWATTPFFLFKFNAKVDSFELEVRMHANPDSFQAHAIKGRSLLYEPQTKTVWMATRSGIRRYDIRTRKLSMISDNGQNELFARANAGALSNASKGAFMYFDNVHKDIVWFDPLKQNIIRRVALKNKFPDAIGSALFESGDGKIWFSSWTDEVAIIDPQNGDSVYSIRSEKNDPLSLPSNSVWAFMQDEDSTIWVGTSVGIAVTNPGKSLFRIHPLEKMIPGIDEKTSLYGFIEDPDDLSWWLLTSKHQVIHYNPFTGKSESKNISWSVPDKDGRKPLVIRALNFFNGKPALSSMEGTWLWQDINLPWIPLEKVIDYNLPIVVRNIIGKEENYYFMTDFKQLIAWDTKTRSVRVIPKNHGRNYDSSGYITPKLNFQHNRPHYADLGKGFITKIEFDSLRPIRVITDPRIINAAYISDIDADVKGNIWICNTGAGLIQYKTSNGSTRVWDETDGLSLNQVGSIAIDNRDNVWSVHRGYYAVLLTKTQTFFNFTLPLASQKHDWENFMYTIQNGNIISNSLNSLLEFFPDRLLLKPRIKLPEISSLHVNGKLIPMLPGKNVELYPDQNDILIRFGLLTDKILFPYLLSYKLDEVDDDWKIAGEPSEAVYNKLTPGKYTFRVRAFAQNGEWQTAENQLIFTIRKPFYNTVWFILLLSFFILSIFYTIYRYRIQKHKQIINLESKASVLEREKATIQYDSLKQQLNPHFLFNSLTSLAGLIEADQEMAGDFLQRMSDMYRYILKNGEQETVLLKDELKFAQLYIDIQQTRFGNGLKLSIDVPDEYLHFKIAPVTLQNLIENAIKHNIIDRSSPLCIRIFTEEEYLIVSNNLQKKDKVETSNKTGLVQFISLYKYLSNNPVIVNETEKDFEVKVPLI